MPMNESRPSFNISDKKIVMKVISMERQEEQVVQNSGPFTFQMKVNHNECPIS